MVVPAELKDVLVSWQRWALGLEGLAFNQVARCAIGHRLVESGHSVLFAPGGLIPPPVWRQLSKSSKGGTPPAPPRDSLYALGQRDRRDAVLRFCGRG